MTKALITGVTGQDGSYLTEFLLEKGYEVHGIVRQVSAFNRDRIDPLYLNKAYGERFFLHYGDASDPVSFQDLIREIQPDEVYNLASQSHVGVSYQIPEYTMDVNGVSVLRLLESIRKVSPQSKFYQASSSEMYGLSVDLKRNESTSFSPASPYATSKLYAYWSTVIARKCYGTFACNGILFNHESPRRGQNFVTKKIARAVVKIAQGKSCCLDIGNLEVARDWGYAKDYVEAMWLMLQQDVADDFVVATGVAHSLREFIELAFDCVGITVDWNGKDLDATGVNAATGQTIVRSVPEYYRPIDIPRSCGDYSKAREVLGWSPRTSFKELVELMVQYELRGMERACC